MSKTFFEELLDELSSSDDPESASIATRALLSELPAPVRDGLLHARRLERVFGPTGLGAAAMLPYELEIR